MELLDQNPSPTLFELGKPERTHHHWTADDKRIMETARYNLDEFLRILQQKGDWQTFAADLVKNDIPTLARLLEIKGLIETQKEEIRGLITEINEAVPESFELPEKS